MRESLGCGVMGEMAVIEDKTAAQRRRDLEGFIQERGLKVTPWAKRAGVAEGTVRNFLAGRSATLTQATVEALAAAADVTPAEIFPSAYHTSGAPQLRQTGAEKTVAPPNKSALTFMGREHATGTGTRDLPILGHVKAGELGFFLDNGDVRGYAVRPSSLLGVKDAYAVYVHDTSMIPAFKPGRVVHVDPTRPVNPGDDVVIELEDGQAFIKELVRRTEKFVICRQWNPAQEIKYDANRVKSLHLIVSGDRITA
jgi:phage repressor protein C with HTH and peptisase S24 domain